MERKRTSFILRALATVALAVVLGAACRAGNNTATQTEATQTEATQTEAIQTEATQTEAAEPAPAVATAERSSEQQPAAREEPTATASQQTQPITSLRDVDFFNGFTYDSLLPYDEDLGFTVEDGSAQIGEIGDEDFLMFFASDLEFGDLDGDGIEEAVLVTTWNGGGTGFFDSVRAYRLVDGRVERSGIVAFGDRADGGVHDLRIVDGSIRVNAFAGGEGACCPTTLSEHTLLLGEHVLIQANVSDARRWVALHDTESDRELQFLAGTDSALLTMYGFATEGASTFEAGAGQTFLLKTKSGPEPTLRTLTNLTTGKQVELTGEVVLEDDGLYELQVTYTQERDELTLMELSIDGSDHTPAVGWTVAIEQELLTSDPLVYSSVTWPVFDSAQPGTAAANNALAAYVTSLDDWWVADVQEYEDPQDDSTYDVGFDVRLNTPDLVSVRLNYYDYVCCRPYPNYGHRSGVLDLASGRLLPVEEILDLTRIDEIHALWLAQLERQDLLPTELFESGITPDFGSVSLTPVGVEFGSDRGALAGGTPGTLTVVSYEDLGDLVNLDLAARAQK